MPLSEDLRATRIKRLHDNFVKESERFGDFCHFAIGSDAVECQTAINATPGLGALPNILYQLITKNDFESNETLRMLTADDVIFFPETTPSIQESIEPALLSSNEFEHIAGIAEENSLFFRKSEGWSWNYADFDSICFAPQGVRELLKQIQGKRDKVVLSDIVCIDSLNWMGMILVPNTKKYRSASKHFKELAIAAVAEFGLSGGRGVNTNPGAVKRWIEVLYEMIAPAQKLFGPIKGVRLPQNLFFMSAVTIQRLSASPEVKHGMLAREEVDLAAEETVATTETPLQFGGSTKHTFNEGLVKDVHRPKPVNHPDEPVVTGTISERMAEMCEKDNRCSDWPASKWAEVLNCHDSSVKKTPLWKSIMKLREDKKKQAQRRQQSR